MNIAELPTRRTEDWKYSDLRLALRDTALPTTDAPAPARSWRTLEGPIDRLALAQGGHEMTEVAPRVDGRAQVLVETLADDGLDARIHEIRVLPGAKLTRILVQTGDGVTLNAAYVSVGAGGVFRQVVVALGGTLARIETHVTVDGAGAEVSLNGVYLCARDRHADLTSVVAHKAVGATTRQLIKGAVRGGGRGVFQGRLIVERGAQKTDARQYHHALLLEEGAEAFAKPELLINADDVQCAHGNTVGALDGEALFYMRARGVPEAEARALLVEAFLGEALGTEIDGEQRADLSSIISSWLRTPAAVKSDLS